MEKKDIKRYIEINLKYVILLTGEYLVYESLLI